MQYLENAYSIGLGRGRIPGMIRPPPLSLGFPHIKILVSATGVLRCHNGPGKVSVSKHLSLPIRRTIQQVAQQWVPETQFGAEGWSKGL